MVKQHVRTLQQLHFSSGPSRRAHLPPAAGLFTMVAKTSALAIEKHFIVILLIFCLIWETILYGYEFVSKHANYEMKK